MSKNDLKLWSCNLRNTKDDNNTESYENASINSDDWTCTENTMENFDNFENFENNESDATIQTTIQNKINKIKTSIFGESEYNDYFFYGSIFLIVMLIVYLTSK